MAGAPTDALVGEVSDAARRVGFMQVIGHGVDLALLDAVYAQADAMAALPDDVRASLRSATGHVFRGLHESMDRNGVRYFGQYQVNTYDDAVEALAAGVDERYADYFHPNVRPDGLMPELRPALDACSQATRALGRVLIGLFARALDLPGDYFDAAFEHDVTQFALNYYPARASVADKPLIAQEHADSGVLTILHQRGDYSGLQVHSSGRWIDVPVRNDAFVINIGQLMHRWTNGVLPATLHRVVAADSPEKSRKAIVTFMLPSVDTVIAPIPSLVEGRPVFAPVTPYAWESDYLESIGLPRAAAKRASV
ncbi:hypothetical protein LWC35_18750 [Pseudonocardia kujensis]|nr:hypothetical protein [Pseudonocardia kujensis]